MRTITPEELQRKIETNDDVVILDVRSAEKYNHDHINEKNVQSINIEKTNIFDLEEAGLEKIAGLPKQKEIIVTCTTGNSARKCSEILSDKGYNVTLLTGGITAWKEFNNRS